MGDSVKIRLTIGPYSFLADLLLDRAPHTCEALRELLPLRDKIIQARWSGEAAWIPLGDLRLGVDYENQTSHPGPGELLFYPGGVSEMEILFPYGGTLFASRVGQLAGNHFATVVEGRAHLANVGRLVWLEGAQDILIEEV